MIVQKKEFATPPRKKIKKKRKVNITLFIFVVWSGGGMVYA